jgi:hypothetical protein
MIRPIALARAAESLKNETLRYLLHAAPYKLDLQVRGECNADLGGVRLLWGPPAFEEVGQGSRRSNVALRPQLCWFRKAPGGTTWWPH